MKSIISAAGAPTAIGPYSQAIEANGFVFTSGQLGFDPATGQLLEGVDAQAHQAITNLETVLAAAGCTLANIVKTTMFLQDLSDFAVVNAIYSERLKKDFPARSCVQVAKLPAGGLVEIECIAAK